MGNTKSQIDKANANVINEIEVGETIDLSRIEKYLAVIVVVMLLNLAVHIYGIHRRRLKKRYLSRATDLNRV